MSTVTTGDNPEGRKDEGHHHQCAPCTLPTDDLHRWQVNFFHQVLLGDHLPSLHHLTADDEHHADDHGGWVHTTRVSMMMRLCGFLPPNVGNTNNSDANHAQQKPQPIETQQSALQEENGQNRGEDHCRASEHLPDAGWDEEHAESTEHCGSDVEGGRHSHQEHLLAVGCLGLVGWVDQVRNQGCLQFPGFRFAANPVEFVDDADEKHCEHHVEGRKPRLMEELRLAIDADANESELNLRTESVQGSCEQHAHDVEQGHQFLGLSSHCCRVCFTLHNDVGGTKSR
mmetsp:Transcript_96064/g.200683  ORF Transcript_96064/g.200683 Transcript_96064/m.200683 type:complete len:285 (+) Transcript_96064:742-1596(+)